MSVRVSNISAMRALPTTTFSLTVANTVYVDSVGDFFRFVPQSSLTAASNYVVTSSDALGQWFRMGIPNPTFLAALYWAIDPVSGNDENQGWGATLAAADLVPLKTLVELDRRLSGNPGYTATVTFHILNSVPIGDARYVRNARALAGASDYPIFLGALGMPLTTGTISNYTTKNTGSGTGATYLVDLTSASTYIGKMLLDQDGRWAFVLAAASANVAVLGIPMRESTGSSVTQGVPGEPTDLVNGKTFAVYSLPAMPSHPFGADQIFGAVSRLDVGSAFRTNFDSYNLGGSQVYYMASIVRGASPVGNGTGGSWAGGFFNWSGCLFQNNSTSTSHTFIGGHHLFHACTVLASHFYLLNATGISIQEEFMLYNAYVQADDTSGVAGIRLTTPRLQLGIFNVTTPAFLGGAVRLPSDTGTVYGAGNTNTLFQIPQGMAWSLPKAGCTAATSGTVLSVGGTAKAFSDIPFVNTTNNASISDGY